jgi:tetratricopeptide (TPR) repeat protein
MKRLFIILVCLIPLFTGCEKKSDPLPAKVVPEQKAPAKVVTPETATPPPTTKHLLQEEFEATLVEVPTQALPIWRQYREQKPTLVLYSRDPFLAQVPATLKEEIYELVLNGAPEKLAERLLFPSADPLILPQMAVSTALSADLFSQVVWVFPATVPINELEGDLISRQLLDFGAIDDDVAQAFSYADGVASGTVRGLPFLAVHPDALPPLDGPVVLHIDLSYFQPLYKGEIKTPLYPLLYQTLTALSKTDWLTLAATLSYSNLSSDLPLATRFIGPTLVSLLREPGMLKEPLPENWTRREKALYLPNFFKTDEVRDLYLEMEAVDPEDASVKFGLYQINRQLKDGTSALAFLAQAVALDPIYGLEYPQLASIALEKGRVDQAVKMLQLAKATLPDNPFVVLQLARLLIQLNHADQALSLLGELRNLPWSQVYFPEMKMQLSELMTNTEELKPDVE